MGLFSKKEKTISQPQVQVRRNPDKEEWERKLQCSTEGLKYKDYGHDNPWEAAVQRKNEKIQSNLNNVRNSYKDIIENLKDPNQEMTTFYPFGMDVFRFNTDYGKNYKEEDMTIDDKIKELMEKASDNYTFTNKDLPLSVYSYVANDDAFELWYSGDYNGYRDDIKKATETKVNSMLAKAFQDNFVEARLFKFDTEYNADEIFITPKDYTNNETFVRLPKEEQDKLDNDFDFLYNILDFPKQHLLEKLSLFDRDVMDRFELDGYTTWQNCTQVMNRCVTSLIYNYFYGAKISYDEAAQDFIDRGPEERSAILTQVMLYVFNRAKGAKHISSLNVDTDMTCAMSPEELADYKKYRQAIREIYRNQRIESLDFTLNAEESERDKRHEQEYKEAAEKAARTWFAIQGVPLK